jgi:hypothetical protein
LAAKKHDPGISIIAQLMKTILLALLASGLCAQAQSLSLATTDGDTFTGITTQRVDPDGLYIEYTLPGGGLGMSKIKFNRLTRAQQREFNYDAVKARDYEAEVAEANQNCSQELIRRDQIERDTRRQNDLENERAYPGRMVAITQLNQSLAESFYAQHRINSGNYGTGGITMGSGYYSSQDEGGRITSQINFTPTAGDIFPNRNIVNKLH